MKKSAAVLAALVLALSLSGCGHALTQGDKQEASACENQGGAYTFIDGIGWDCQWAV